VLNDIRFSYHPEIGREKRILWIEDELYIHFEGKQQIIFQGQKCLGKVKDGWKTIYYDTNNKIRGDLIHGTFFTKHIFYNGEFEDDTFQKGHLVVSPNSNFEENYNYGWKLLMQNALSRENHTVHYHGKWKYDKNRNFLFTGAVYAKITHLSKENAFYKGYVDKNKPVSDNGFGIIADETGDHTYKMKIFQDAQTVLDLNYISKHLI
jgi:hypothetical protein